jgi:RNA polymerase sigma factor (sigma-70 family)
MHFRTFELSGSPDLAELSCSMTGMLLRSIGRESGADMSFPDTRLSLIRRIVATGDAASWDEFVASYWRAVCRFAMRLGNLQWADSEDVASLVFEALFRKSLLESWLTRTDARFKTLLCTVVRNVVQNTNRANRTAARQIDDQFEQALLKTDGVDPQDADAFMAIWADELIQSTVRSLMTDYHNEGKGDYYRVLHSRICEEMSTKEIADLLGVKLTDVDNYYRHARQRLGEGLKLRLRMNISYYTDLADLDAEFHREWQHLAEILQRRGGLEVAIRNGMSSTEL